MKMYKFRKKKVPSQILAAPQTLRKFKNYNNKLIMFKDKITKQRTISTVQNKKREVHQNLRLSKREIIEDY